MSGAKEETMGDKYTVYPEALKKRIENTDKFLEAHVKEKERLSSLTPEQLEAEQKEADRLAALSEEEREAEAKKKAEDSLPPDTDAEETVDSLKEKIQKLEQSLQTLRGKYDKEPAELQRQNNFLQEQIGILQQEILALKEKPKAVEPKKVVLSEAIKEDIEALKQDLAPDIVDKIVKINERTFELGREEAKQAITEVATKFDSKLALTAKERFDKELLDAYPDWEVMWKTPEFQIYLAEPDDFTGIERYAFIQDAFKRLDSRAVIRAFDLFKGKKRHVATEDRDKINMDTDKLKNRVAAPRSSSPGVPNQPIKQGQISPQEARQALVALASAYSRGQYRGSKEQYDKEYARLHALSRQGTG
jgi:hypothetical protein